MRITFIQSCSLRLLCLLSLVIFTVSSAFATIHVPAGNQSGTWTKANSPYILDGSVTVASGSTLTIQAGVTVIFSSASVSLNVNGILNAQGSSVDSVRFKGQADVNNSSYKYGGSVYISGSGSIMKYVSIDSLGDPNYVQSSLSIYDTLTPVITNLSVKHSGGFDIYCWAGGAKNMSNINGVVNIAAGYVYYNATMPKVGGNTYYNLLGSLTVNQGATLTINSGVKVIFPSASISLTINGKLNAQGSSTDSIILKGKKDVSNSAYKYGGAIYINGSGTVMNYISIDSLGDPNYVQSSVSIYDTLTPSIKNTSIKHSGTLDIYSWIGGGKNMSNVNGIFNVSPGYVYYNATMPKIGGNTYYNLSGTATVNSGVTLTMNSGITVVFPSASVSLTVNGILKAQGSSSDTIRFKGKADVSNSSYKYGGALYINGSGTTMNYVSLDSLGDPNYVQSAISVYDTLTPTITNTSIRHSGSLDIYSWAGGGKNMSTINGVFNIAPGYMYYDAVMPKIGGNTYYNLVGTLTVYAGTTLTINPGVTVKFPSASISMNVNGKLIAQGTISDSIMFKGQADIINSYKYGGSLYINGSGTVMNYVSLDSLGDSHYVQSAITIYDTLTPVITNVSIKHSGSWDIYSWVGGGKNMSNINGIFNVAPGYMYYDALMPKINGNTYYNLLGTLTINSGVTLTINPGVTVIFPSAFISLNINGKLNAQGLSSDSIRLKGQADVINSYKYGGALYINGSGTVMNYVSLDSLGDSHYVQSSISIYDTLTPTITNTSVKHSGSLDIYSWAGGGKNMANINGVINISPGYIYYDAVMPKVEGNTYYNLLGTITVNKGTTLTVRSGVKVIFPSASVSIYANGVLNAQGTASDSITFKGTADVINNYKYGGSVNITGPGSVLNYVTIDSLGDNSYTTGALYIYDTLTPVIQNTLVKHSGNMDIYCWAGGAKNMSNVNGVINVSAGSVYANAIMPKVGGTSYYKLYGTVTIPANTTLTIQPGATLVFPSAYTDLTINGTLNARGNINDTIRFKGAKDVINNTLYGGSINLNTDGSNLSFISIDSMGGYNNGAVMASAGFSMKYTSIRNNKSDGVSIYSPKASISYSNITKNVTGVGVYYCKAVINNCNIYSNTSYGANNVTLSYQADATQNYWGATSGPYHPTLNKKGTGNKVSDSVNFQPFKTTIVLPTLPYISTFSPSAAATDTVIKITGLRFTGATKVLFGNTAAKSFTVVNDSTINATVGAGSSGYVKVTTAQGSDSLGGLIYCSGIALHADFTYTTSLFDVYLTNASTDATSYIWNFGDGDTTSTASPSHEYDTAGTYTICLSDTNVCAKRAETVCKMVVIYGLAFVDDDKDGLNDLTEAAQYGTAVGNFDTNGDWLGDGPNVFTGLSALSLDTDGDGISNAQELINGTSPVMADTDGDGVNDKLDPFPLDRYRSKLPANNASDHTAPVITLSEPF